jgi:hypothetical protein
MWSSFGQCCKIGVVSFIILISLFVPLQVDSLSLEFSVLESLLDPTCCSVAMNVFLEPVPFPKLSQSLHNYIFMAYAEFMQ